MKNPFAAVQRPYIDLDYSPPGYTKQEWVRLLVTGRDGHRVATYRKRAYALLLMLYTCCLRIDSLLKLGSRISVMTRATGSCYWRR